MRAMVMAAGRGTRLAPFTDALPKPALPVANEPVMGHLLRLLARHGIRDVVANIHYRADDMRRVFGDGTAFGVNLAWSYEHELLGTAGGVKNVAGFLLEHGDTCIVLSGDGLHDVDLNRLVAQHHEAQAWATIALSPVSDPSEYGVAILDDDGFIVAFQEKPSRDEARSNLCNTGIYVFGRELLDRIPAGEFHDFGNDVFPALMRDGGRRVLGVPVEGYWNDIGGLEAYRDGNLAAVDGRMPLAGGDEAGGEQLVHPTARVAADATLIGPCVVGAGACVGAGAQVSHSVLLPGASIEAGALVGASTIGSADGLARWLDDLT